MICRSCGAPVGKGIDECPQCGVAMFAKDRKQQGIYDQSSDKRKHTEDMFTARYEQHRYGLMPQQENEGDEAFCKRVNDNKTPHIIAEHKVILANLEGLKASRSIPPRDPGEEG